MARNNSTGFLQTPTLDDPSKKGGGSGQPTGTPNQNTSRQGDVGPETDEELLAKLQQRAGNERSSSQLAELRTQIAAVQNRIAAKGTPTTTVKATTAAVSPPLAMSKPTTGVGQTPQQKAAGQLTDSPLGGLTAAVV